MVRLTAAAVASYEVARLLFPGTLPLLAPLTALLVVQVTPISLLASGLDRVLSVVLGVSVAVVFAEIFGLSWWSLGLVIAVSIGVGQILRLQANLLEVPISAMLVLGVGSCRCRDCRLAAGDGDHRGRRGRRAVQSALPAEGGHRGCRCRNRGRSVRISRGCWSTPRTSSTHAHDITATAGSWTARVAWLDEARIITHGMPNVGAALLRAEESRRLNVRALAQPDSGPALRHGMESLEHASVTVRSMFRAHRGCCPPARCIRRLRPRPLDRVRKRLARLRRAPAYIRSPGPDRGAPGDESDNAGQLRDALDRILEARARLTDLVLADPRADPALNTLTIRCWPRRIACCASWTKTSGSGARRRRQPQRFSLRRDRRDGTVGSASRPASTGPVAESEL